MNKKKLFLPMLLLAIGVGGFAALKATRPRQAAAPPSEQVWRVEVMTAKPGQYQPMLSLNGKVENPETTRIAAPGPGRVMNLSVREGQWIHKGERLLAMDDRDFLPRVEQAQGEVDELLAAMRSEELRHAADQDQMRHEQKLAALVAADVARFERLQQENFYSPAAVDQSRQTLARQQISLRSRELAIADHAARLAQLQGRLARARADLQTARLALARSQVVAPFDGYVANVAVAAGDQVTAGQVLMTVYPAAGMEIRAKIPAPYQQELSTALAKGERLGAFALLDGTRLDLHLSRLSGAADNRGLDGFFMLDKKTAFLRTGSLLSLQMARLPVDNVISVPYSALYGGTQVYRVEDDSRIRAMNVSVIGEQAGEVPRLLIHNAAIKAGDRLLVTHLPNAVSGMKVEVMR